MSIFFIRSFFILSDPVLRIVFGHDFLTILNKDHQYLSPGIKRMLLEKNNEKINLSMILRMFNILYYNLWAYNT